MGDLAAGHGPGRLSQLSTDERVFLSIGGEVRDELPSLPRGVIHVDGGCRFVASDGK
jgi:hypothetical protein